MYPKVCFLDPDHENYPQQGDIYTSSVAYPKDTEGNENYNGNNGGCDESVHEVQLSAGQFLRDALVSDTESDGLYPNHTCQNWNIITDENRVSYLQPCMYW